jgi:signal transduction histidine kinase
VATSFLLSAAADRVPAAAATTRDELTGAARTVRESIGGLRSLLVDIYPPSLQEEGLDAALHDLATGVTARGIRCAVLVDLDGGPPLPEAVEHLVFRIAHEALVNVAKHSHASSASVTLVRKASEVELVVADDGAGFDPAALRTGRPEHFGLRLLADAVRDSGLDAELGVRAAPGRGTAWHLVVRA